MINECKTLMIVENRTKKGIRVLRNVEFENAEN